MTHRYSLKHSDLVSDLALCQPYRPSVAQYQADHMFPACHEPLVDDLRGIVSSCINVHALLDYRVAACTQSLASLVSARLYLRCRLCTLRPRHAVRSFRRHCYAEVGF
jgi:hypothetical protein